MKALRAAVAPVLRMVGRHAVGRGKLPLLMLAFSAITLLASPIVDIDADSDNDAPPPGYPARSPEEDAIENVTGDPHCPGKLVPVNDDDDDGDGIPDFADGYNLGLQPGEDDDVTSAEDDLVPIVLDVSGLPDPMAAHFYISYFPISYPGGQGQSGVTLAGDPPAYVPGFGDLRLWRTWPGNPRNPLPLKQGGDLVEPGGPYSAQELGLTPSCTLWLEAVRPSTQLASHQLWLYADPDGYGPEGPTLYGWPPRDPRPH